MISPKFLILVVCLLQAQRVFAFKHIIDLERCRPEAKDATCFVRGSCISTANPDGKTSTVGDKTQLVQYKPTDKVKLQNGDCDVIMQIKPFTAKKWHVMMKVKGTNLDPAKGISFTQGQTQFSCKFNTATLQGELKPKKLGEGEVFLSDLMFCSITIDGDAKDIAGIFLDNENKPALSYFANNKEQKLEFASSGHKIWTLPKASCNPERITSKTVIADGFQLQEIDTTLPILLNHRHCIKKYGRGSYLKIRHDGKYHDVDYLYCDAENHVGPRYIYSQGKKYENIDPAITPFEVYCAVCSKCPEFVFKSCPGCSGGVTTRQEFSPCTIGVCPLEKWRQPNGSVKYSHKAYCKQVDDKKAGWFLEDETNKTTEIELINEGSCSTTNYFDCSLNHKLKFTCPPKKSNCEKAIHSPDKKTISCLEGFVVNFGSTIAASWTCNPTTGHYTDGKDDAAKDANVYCEKTTPPAKPKSLAEGEDSWLEDPSTMTLWVVSGMVLLLGVVIVVAVVVYLRR